MSAPDNIEHQGIIEDIDKDYFYVRIKAHAACGGCQAKSICNLTEVEHKIIEIKRRTNKDYKIGDEVTVVLTRSLGFKAVVLGYLVPFFVLMFVLILALQIIPHEPSAALISITVLALYYGILYLHRDKLKKTFDFRLKN